MRQHHLALRPYDTNETINAHADGSQWCALAVSTPVTSLWINPKEVYELAHPNLSEKKPKKPIVLDVESLAVAIGLEPADLSARLRKNAKKEFLYLKRHLPPDIAQVEIETSQRFMVLLNIAVIIQKAMRPHTSLVLPI